MPFSERDFHAHFGVSQETVNILWMHICSSPSEFPFTFDHLLWALYFLKVYPTADVASSFWSVSQKTFHKWTWKMILFLVKTLDTVRENVPIISDRQFSISERFQNGVNMVNMVLDATECPIEKPIDWTTQNRYYSGKKKKHTIKYEVGVQINTGKIVWVAGGLPGSIHDLTMAKSCRIIGTLLPGERILADKGYTGDDHFLVPFKSPGSESERMWNKGINETRVIVENTYNRIKVFNCLKSTWRNDIDLHIFAFSVSCEIVNIEVSLFPIRK